MRTPNDTSVPSGYKRCSKGVNCINTLGCVLPATTEYFLVRRDTKCGLTSHCRKCHNAEGASWVLANPEKDKEYHKEWYQRDIEKHRAVNRAWGKANPEKKNEHARRWKANNPEKSKAAHLKSRQAHPEMVRRITHNRRARLRNLDATFSEHDWLRCLEYFGNCCAVCGRPRGLWHTISQDHWIPTVKGGHYTKENIVPLCHSLKGGTDSCNNAKLDRDADEWLIAKYGKRKAKSILKRIIAYFEWLKEHE